MFTNPCRAYSRDWWLVGISSPPPLAWAHTQHQPLGPSAASGPTASPAASRCTPRASMASSSSSSETAIAAAASVAVGGEPFVDDTAIARQVAAKSKDDILGSIKRLRDQQNALRQERKLVAKNLRNEEKRRKRLRKKARMLSDGDLVALLKMRAEDVPDGPGGDAPKDVVMPGEGEGEPSASSTSTSASGP